jgi:N-acetylmuramoyl-L-alanine amidase
MKILNHHLCDDDRIAYDANGVQYKYCEVKNFDRGSQYQFKDTYYQLEYIVIHHTVSGTWMSAYETFNNSSTNSGSAHLIIDRDGTVVQCVPFNTFAWHAGDSQWADRGVRSGSSSLNRYSIGIEMVNWGPEFVKDGDVWNNVKHNITLPDEDVLFATSKHGFPHDGCGWQKFPEAQIEAAVTVVQALMSTYPSILDIVGHEDIKKSWDSMGDQEFYNNDPRGDPMTDREDPGPAFPMAIFRARLLELEEGKPEKFQAILSLVVPEYRFLCTEPCVNGRKIASTEKARALNKGEEVEVIDRQWWWAKVRAENQDGTTLEGWIPERYLKRIR